MRADQKWPASPRENALVDSPLASVDAIRARVLSVHFRADVEARFHDVREWRKEAAETGTTRRTDRRGKFFAMLGDVL